jgi:homoserine O-succinyltransferase
MPVRVPNDLPARKTLAEENIFVMTRERAVHQDIRPLRIAVLNLMPTKIVTETQLLRLLGNSPLQVDITFIRVETLPFEKVDYWPELCRLMDWSRTSVWSTLHICWGAQAALYRHFGVPKYPLPAKMFGLFPHRVLEPREPLLRGFDEVFYAPHSRHTEVRQKDVEAVKGVKLLAVSDEAGVYMAASEDGRMVFVTGHPEYDRLTLKAEYDRDAAKGLPIAVPRNYFPGDDPSKEPLVTWRSHAHLLYANWLNYYVYQTTPYDLDRLPSTDTPLVRE